jgi:outer membrane beta-barrel protein
MAVHIVHELSRKRLIANRLFLFYFLLVLAMLLSPRPVFAATQKQVIEFPDEELASESVLPVFDHPEAVKNRLVPTAKRLELGVFGTYLMTEAFFNPLAFGVNGTYHINETHGVNLMAQSYLTGVSNYAKQLNPIPGPNGSPGTANANLQFAPAPKYLVLANYQYTAFYGKISLTKDYVMNLSLYGLAGIGAMGIGDSTAPVASLGLGQKFYLGNSFALRFDLRGVAYSGPDILSIPLDSKTSEVSASQFDKKLQFGTLLSAGIVYILPSF